MMRVDGGLPDGGASDSLVEKFRDEGFAFPEERAQVARLQVETVGWTGEDAIEWGLETGVFNPTEPGQPGTVDCAEFSPTLRCSENCTGCPDARDALKARVDLGLEKRQEDRATPAVMLERVKLLKELGVRHVMNIGGTIDPIRWLPDLVKTELDEGLVVSWFSDFIPEFEETGEPTDLLRRNLDDGWIRKVATHVSTDYLFQGDLYADEIVLPPKRARTAASTEDPEYSRVFKSQYSIVGAKKMVEENARRVVLNMTISHANAGLVLKLYDQATKLQDHADAIGSPTEVLFTFSPWIWRPHQARGDQLSEHSPEDGLHLSDMQFVGPALNAILMDTYGRVSSGRPRILANSSAYTSLHSDPRFERVAVDQDVGYPGGRPVLLDVKPSGQVMLDSMFPGRELAVVRNTFGYMDRTPYQATNPFVEFQDPDLPYLPNIISLQSRNDEAAQPQHLVA